MNRISAHPPPHHRLVVAVVVVHQPQRIIGVFAREAVGVRLGDVEGGKCRVGRRGRNRTERGVLIMRGYAAGGLVGDKIRNVLVAVMEVEEVVCARGALHPQGTCHDRLGRIPTEGEVDVVVRRGIETLNAEVAVVDKAMVDVGSSRDSARPSCTVGHHLDVFNTTPHAIKGHREKCGSGGVGSG